MKKRTRSNKSSASISLNWKVIGTALAVAIGASGIALAVVKLRVDTVRCQLDTGDSCPEELSAITQTLKGKSLFFTDYASILAQHNNQPVTLQSIQKSPPASLLLTFKEEKPVYILTQGETSYSISQSGKRFSHIPQNQELIQVETQENLVDAEGQVSHDFHQSVVAILETIRKLELPLHKMVWVDKSTIKLSIENRSELFVIDSEQPTLELHRLAIVLASNEYRAISEPKQELDLRFTMPVLRTQP